MSTILRGGAPVLAALALFTPHARAQDVSTSFEFNNLSGLFTLGTAPFDATFADGLAQSIGVFSLYHTGLRAWMIPAGQTGTISFGTPAEELHFFFRDQSGTVNSVLTVRDTDGGVVATFNGTQASWTQVSLTAPIGGPFLDEITLQHNGPAGFTVIDDFDYFAVGGVGGGPALTDPIPAVIRPSRLVVRLETVTSGLQAPNYGFGDPIGAGRLFVSDQPGQLLAIELATGTPTVFLDVSSRLVPLGVFGAGTFDERGLLGFAFHPDYDQNGLLYTYTSEPVAGTADFSTMPMGTPADHQTVVAEWAVPSPLLTSSVVDPGSRRELLRIDEPQFNHNAGCMNFGPDGFLYVSLGDGGGADDADGQDFLGSPIVGHGSTGNGQDKETVLGTLLRIDPDGTNSANGNYGIPFDNPFVGAPGIDEIYAYGFRNPFRFSFDTVTGALLVADVGQNDIEEVDLVTAGGNYGWNLKEGSFFFEPNGLEEGFVTLEDPGVPPGLIDPIAEYDHDEGIAIVGGFVYRGSAAPLLAGSYVFGDFSQTFFGNDGRLFVLTPNLHLRELRLPLNAPLGLSLLGFGQDADGELYVLGNTTGTPSGGTGVVLKIASASRPPFLGRPPALKGSVSRQL